VAAIVGAAKRKRELKVEEQGPSAAGDRNFDICVRCLKPAFKLLACDGCVRSLCFPCLEIKKTPTIEVWLCGQCTQPLTVAAVEAQARYKASKKGLPNDFTTWAADRRVELAGLPSDERERAIERLWKKLGGEGKPGSPQQQPQPQQEQDAARAYAEKQRRIEKAMLVFPQLLAQVRVKPAYAGCSEDLLVAETRKIITANYAHYYAIIDQHEAKMRQAQQHLLQEKQLQEQQRLLQEQQQRQREQQQALLIQRAMILLPRVMENLRKSHAGLPEDTIRAEATKYVAENHVQLNAMLDRKQQESAGGSSAWELVLQEVAMRSDEKE
jgi:hypothetical protein